MRFCGTLATATLFLACTLGASAAPACPDGAFVSVRQGDINSVEWVKRSGTAVTSHAIANQVATADGTVRTNSDQTTAALDAWSYTTVGSAPKVRPVKTVPGSRVLWWDLWPSTLQQVTLRATTMHRAHAIVPLYELVSGALINASVDRENSFEWNVRVRAKRYTVLTDATGCLQAATMPDYALTIERHANFDAKNYPLWPYFQAPLDGAYRAEEVRIPASAGHVLAGTLTMPLHPTRRLPAVIMITGISPHDRDEGPGISRPFRDVADSLTRAGIAVLRVDDRGIGQSTGERASTTTLDEADDVNTEFAWLAKRPEIDPARIALVGHSEGGFITQIVAAANPRVFAIVSLAGPGFKGDQIFEYQTRIDIERNANVPAWDRENRIHATLTEPLPTLRDKWFVASDPIPYARRVRVPALLVQGGNDLHVSPSSALHLAEAMRAGGNSDVTIALFPGVSHTLVYDADGTAAGWATIPAWRIPRTMLDTIRDWLLVKFH